MISGKLTVGGYRIQVIHTGIYWWDAGSFFGVVPKTLWLRRMTPDDSNRLRFAFNSCVVEDGRHTVLIETGAGNRLAPAELSRMGMPQQLPPLPEILAAHGVAVDRIDMAINTHLHYDHRGGNTLERNGHNMRRHFLRPGTSRSVASGNIPRNVTSGTL